MTYLGDWQQAEANMAAATPRERLEFGVYFTELELVELQEVVGALDETVPWSQAVYAKLGRALVNARRTKAADA